MPVPSNIADLSQTPSVNSPPGTEAVGTLANDYHQAAYAFIATLRDRTAADWPLAAISGFSATNVQAAILELFNEKLDKTSPSFTSLLSVTMGAAPQALLNRTGSATNSVMEFRTTSGSVYAGQGSAGRFAVAGTANLTTGQYFECTPSQATFPGTVQAASFIGSGASLTGVAPSLKAGGATDADRVLSQGATDANALDTSAGIAVYSHTTGAVNFPSTIGYTAQFRRAVPGVGSTPTFQLSSPSGTGPQLYHRKVTSFTSSEQWSSWARIWHENDQGSGSGMDADLLDGQQGTFYRTADNITAGTLPAARLSASVDYDIGGGSTFGSAPIGFRNAPRRTSGFANGEVTTVTTGQTINTSAASNCFSIYNNSAASIILTEGASVTLRLHGTSTTGNRTLAARGMATLWWNSSTEACVMGDVT